MKKFVASFLFLIFSFFIFSTSSPSLIRDTFVKISPGKTRLIQDLHEGDEILSIGKDDEKTVFKQVKIEAIKKVLTNKLIAIKTSSGVVFVSENERFYNPEKAQWIIARKLTTRDKLFSLLQSCLSIEKIDYLYLEKPIETYELCIEEPHVYFVCDFGGNSILVHNNWFIDLILKIVGKGGGEAVAGTNIGPVLSTVAAPVFVTGMLVSAAINAIKKDKEEKKTQKNERDGDRRNSDNGGVVLFPQNDVGDGYITKEDIERNRKWGVYGEMIRYLKEQEQKKNATASPAPQPPKKDDDDKKDEKKDNKNLDNTQKQESKTEGKKPEEEIVITRGKGQAPKTAAPNSIYEKIDNEDPRVVVSRTKYNSNGLPETREDYYTGSKPREHFDDKTGQYLKDHEHIFKYNEKGQKIGEEVVPFGEKNTK